MSDTAKSFGYKWDRWKDICYSAPVMEEIREEFIEMFELPGWAEPRSVLDAGCGLARYREFFPAGTIYQGIDLSTAAEIARKRYSDRPDTKIDRGDLMNLRRDRLHQPDMIISVGVLHHLPNTEKGFMHLASLLKDGAELCVSVYSRKSQMREFLDDAIRRQTTKMSYEECFEVAAALAATGRELTKAKVMIAGMSLQRFIYWNVLKCYHNEEFGDDYSECVMFDWLSPPYAHSHTGGEVRSWAENAGLVVESFRSSGAAHWIRARRS